jgi:hypothetical protein
MRLKFDAFTWVVIAVVAALVVAAVVTVNAGSRFGPGELEYMAENSPAAPVYNAYIAVQRGDAAEARAQFSESALAEHDKVGYDPIAQNISFYANDQGSRRVRIVQVQEESPDEAFVTVVEDSYSGGGGLFGRSTWSNQRVIRVVREDGVWKVDVPNMFY